MVDWFVSLILVPAISGFVRKLPDLIGGELQTRGTIRTQENQARLDEVAERRAAAREREADERSRLLERYQNQVAHYPLGAIGRLADKTRDGRPAVLVSPVDWGGSPADRLPGYVHDALREIAEFPQYAELHTGAFVVGRTIRGSVGAEEISALEFPGYPAIIIYFEAEGAYLNAFAYLGALLPTVDDSPGFSIQIARFGRRGRPTTAEPGDLPTWQYVNLSEVEQPAEQVVAAIVAWFVLSCLELHWHLRGLAAVDLHGRLLGTKAGVASATAEMTGDVFACRLEMELRTLELEGYAPATMEYGDERMALIVADGELEIAFVLTPDYPASPPEVFYVSGSAAERVTIGPSDWSPERTLLQLVDGVRALEGVG
jgi:hypothetical protein